MTLLPHRKRLQKISCYFLYHTGCFIREIHRGCIWQRETNDVSEKLLMGQFAIYLFRRDSLRCQEAGSAFAPRATDGWCEALSISAKVCLYIFRSGRMCTQQLYVNLAFPPCASSCWDVAERGRCTVLHNFYRQLAPPLTLLPSDGYSPTGKTLHLPLLCLCFASVLSRVVATLLIVFIWDRYSQKAGNSHAQAFKIPKKLTPSSLSHIS